MCLRASYLKTVPHQKQTLFNYKFLGKHERASNIDSLLIALSLLNSRMLQLGYLSKTFQRVSVILFYGEPRL
jgi:hypothetical protein